MKQRIGLLLAAVCFCSNAEVEEPANENDRFLKVEVVRNDAEGFRFKVSWRGGLLQRNREIKYLPDGNQSGFNEGPWAFYIDDAKVNGEDIPVTCFPQFLPGQCIPIQSGADIVDVRGLTEGSFVGGYNKLDSRGLPRRGRNHDIMCFFRLKSEE